MINEKLKEWKSIKNIEKTLKENKKIGDELQPKPGISNRWKYLITSKVVIQDRNS